MEQLTLPWPIEKVPYQVSQTVEEHFHVEAASAQEAYDIAIERMKPDAVEVTDRRIYRDQEMNPTSEEWYER